MNASTETWPRPHRLTVAEYYRMAEVGLLAPDARVELIEGAIIDMAPIGCRHAAAVNRLAKRFIDAVQESAIVSIQSPLRLSDISEPQPDLALLAPRADRYANSHPTADDVLLVVEVSDTTVRFDVGAKARLYARHGVPELWTVDIPGRNVHFFQEPGADGYARTSRAARPRPARVALADVSIDLSDLF